MRSALAVVLAFGALLLTPPAQANWQSNQVFIDGDTIQFSYVWGWAEREVQGEIFVTVDNTVTNKIGYDGEVIDSYRIIFGDQVIEGAEKGVFAYTFTATESQVIRIEGIDNGFWGGYYGPIVTVTQAVQEIPSEPVTESPTVSQEVTPSVSEEVTESSTSEVSLPEPTPQDPQPEPQPEIESPSPEPLPTTASPEPEPEVSESSPVESTESPVSESATSTTSQVTQSAESLQPTPEQTLEPQPLATTEPVQPSPEPIPEVTNAPTQPAEETTQEPEETQSDSVSARVEATDFKGLTEAVGAVINAFATAGLDMSPEKREEAQEVIVSSVIVSQVAATATAAVRKK